MITITDIDGNDITQTSPPPLTLTTNGAFAACRLRLMVLETEALPARAIQGTVGWGDGHPDDTITGNGTVAVNLTRSLAPGSYVVNVYATDRQLPTPSEASAALTVNVLLNPQIAQPTNIVYGPVLPRDQGFPGPKDWIFNTGHDVGVLESSLKMLLSTARGERTMEPDYGTSLRQMLFDPLTDALKSAVTEEVTSAVARWEPRVQLQFLELAQDLTDGRKVILRLAFSSRLSAKPINLDLQFQYD